MSYDRSHILQIRHLENTLDPPPPYRRRLSIKEFLAIFIPSLLGLIVLVGSLWYFFGFHLVFYALLVFVFVYFMYREYYKWSRNHLKCDPEDGVLYMEDRAHPFILFFINGSDDDPIPLNDLALDTPTVSFLDKWVFHCGTLGAGKRKLKGVKRIDELLAIQKYGESLKKQSVNLGKEQVDVQMATLETLESMGEDLHNLVGLVSSLTQHVLRLTASMPQQVPTLPTTSVPTRQPVAGSDDEEPPNDK